MIPRIHKSEPCPLDGYESLAVNVLQNPTAAEWELWQTGHLGVQDCPTCTKEAHCADCAAARARFAQAMHAFYGQQPAASGLDFSTPEAALATIERSDVPDEILCWLVQLPTAIWTRRRELIQKNLFPSPGTAA